MRRSRSRPKTTDTTVSITVSSLSTGAQAANSFTGWTSPATSTVVSDTRWGATGKHLLAGSSSTFMAKTTGVSRDQEVSTWMQRGTVYLRLTDAGTAIALTIAPETNNFQVNVLAGLAEGTASGGSISGVGYTSIVTGSFLVALGSLASVPGYSASSNSGHYWTFGCDRFDVYLKYNGVEFWRTKQLYHLEPGRIALAAQTNYGFRDVTATLKVSSSGYSDFSTKTFDIRDWGMKSMSAVGSMTAGSPTLTLTSNPGFVVGDKVCVATGGEAGGGIPGERGVGGQWPSLLYATTSARDSDTTQVVNKVCGVLANGNAYQWTGSAWVAYQGNLAKYLNKIVPKALVATITNVSGTTLTLDTNATVSTTNAGVYFDSGDDMVDLFGGTGSVSGIRQQPGCTISIPAGTEWVFANRKPLVGSVPGLRIVGAGIDDTVIFSPPGTSEAGFQITNCNNAYTANMSFMGNTRDDKGYMFGFNATTDQWSTATSFVRLTGCIGALTENIRGTNYSQGVTEFAFCEDSVQRFIEVIHETGHKQYFQWAVNISDSTNCVSEDIYFDGPWLFKGLESFRSEGSILRRATGRNFVISSNSNTQATYEDCSVVYETGCADSPFNAGLALGAIYPDPREPLVNLNSNIDNTSGSTTGTGITIRNCDFDVQGRIWTGYGFWVIGISGTVDNVVIQGRYPAKPVLTPSGRVTLPTLGSDIVRLLRNDATGKTITIDGVRVDGTYTQTPVGSFGGAIVSGTTIRNSVIENLSSGGTQTNNITNAEYEAL